MPTALELTRQEWRRYFKSASKRPEVPRLGDQHKKDRDQVLIRVREAASALKKTFGVRRVLVFGSLGQGDWFSQDSDVDLAVEGLRGSDYWQALKVAEDTIADRHVDLIEIEMATESLKKAIQHTGVEL